MRTRIAVVYHSGFGHTEQQAKAVCDGAKDAGAEDVAFLKAEDLAEDDDHAGWDRLDRADAIIFGAPTYMGSASADFKRFQDKTSDRWHEQAWKNKLAAGFTNSSALSGDKLNTLMQFSVFAAQHSMLWVPLGLMPGNNSTQGSEDDLNRIGGFLGAMARSLSDLPADKAPPQADLNTAKALGARVVEVAQGWYGVGRTGEDAAAQPATV